MSAHIVDKRHIDFLVAAILRSEAVPEAGVDADHIGRVLWRENHKSVNGKYNERARAPKYRYVRIELPSDVAYLHCQVAYYQYQSCEHSGWERSDAYKWTQRLREMWEVNLRAEWGDNFRNSPAYIAAPWGIDGHYVVPPGRA